MGWFQWQVPCRPSRRGNLPGALRRQPACCHPAAAPKSEMKIASASPELTFQPKTCPGYALGENHKGLLAKSAMLMPLTYWLLAGLEGSLRANSADSCPFHAKNSATPVTTKNRPILRPQKEQTSVRHDGCPVFILASRIGSRFALPANRCSA